MSESEKSRADPRPRDIPKIQDGFAGPGISLITERLLCLRKARYTKTAAQVARASSRYSMAGGSSELCRGERPAELRFLYTNHRSDLLPSTELTMLFARHASTHPTRRDCIRRAHSPGAGCWLEPRRENGVRNIFQFSKIRQGSPYRAPLPLTV